MAAQLNAAAGESLLHEQPADKSEEDEELEEFDLVGPTQASQKV